ERLGLGHRLAIAARDQLEDWLRSKRIEAILATTTISCREWWRVTPEGGAWSIDVLIAKLREVELGQAFGVGEEVDLGDLPILDCDGGDRERPAMEEADHPGRAVDECASHGQVDSGPEQGLAGDGFR